MSNPMLQNIYRYTYNYRGRIVAKRLRDQYRERKEAEWLANYNLERMQHYELRIKAAKDLLERMQKHKDLQVIDETSWK
ncbi:MAG: hypothetical protein MMC33_005218 [Icmadophila ericetorum]|nr:hypothetical protein [Icmadophila ericetorum]